jgi:hypothetical protein
MMASFFKGALPAFGLAGVFGGCDRQSDVAQEWSKDTRDSLRFL